MSNPTDAEKRTHLRKIVNAAQTAFFVTHTPEGTLHGRPMATAEVAEDFDALWFSTSRVSGKIHDLRADAKVFLGYSNSSGSEWASVTGRATVINDREKIRELWSPFWKTWFDGPDDPNLVLIKVTPESAEYWDTGSRVIVMAKMAISAVTGKKLEVGENEKIELR